MSKTIEFGKNLKELRTTRGLTRNELAAILSYSYKAIEKWEAGVSFPPITIISELSDYFGVSLEELVYKKNSNVKYFLGIDGGGTKTSFLILGKKSEIISEIKLGASNPIDIGLENCKKVLSSGIENVCYGLDKSEIAVFAGISGIEDPDTEYSIYNFFNSMRFNAVGVSNDIENAIEISLGDENGIVLICGTGVASYVIKDKKRYKIAGNGYLFDNGGSGFDIGRDAFQAAFEQIDGRGEDTIITGLLTEKLGETLPRSIDRIYKCGKRYVASASELVFKAYRLGDKTAERIIRKNADDIAKIIKAGLNHFDNNDVNVAICGGLSNESEILLKYLSPALRDRCNLKFVQEPAVYGAVKRAQKLVKEDE